MNAPERSDAFLMCPEAQRIISSLLPACGAHENAEREVPAGISFLTRFTEYVMICRLPTGEWRNEMRRFIAALILAVMVFSAADAPAGELPDEEILEEVLPESDAPAENGQNRVGEAAD